MPVGVPLPPSRRIGSHCPVTRRLQATGDRRSRVPSFKLAIHPRVARAGRLPHSYGVSAGQGPQERLPPRAHGVGGQAVEEARPTPGRGALLLSRLVPYGRGAFAAHWRRVSPCPLPVQPSRRCLPHAAVRHLPRRAGLELQVPRRAPVFPMACCPASGEVADAFCLGEQAG